MLFTYKVTEPPSLLKIGGFKIHWYGVMYLVGFGIAWLLGNYRAKSTAVWNKVLVSDLIFYCMIGVILGGRFGYMVFYNFSQLISEPSSFFKVWEGGMSFHGGLIGVGVSMYLFSWRMKIPFFNVTDFTAPLVPLALGAGRLGNFINGELWGRVTDIPWGVVFAHVDNQSRHPSQLYEFFLEGIVLFILVWWYSAKPKPRMAVTGLFLVGYGAFRFFIEFFREPDAHIGFVALKWLTMGQLLSLPMILFGAWMLWWGYNRRNRKI